MSNMWGFDLDMAAVRLLRRDGSDWREIALEKIDGADIEDRLMAMVALMDSDAPVELFLPRDQILYTDVEVTSEDTARDEIERAMDGQTPYPLEDLDLDWEMTGPTTARVAAIALETLDEAVAPAHVLVEDGRALLPARDDVTRHRLGAVQGDDLEGRVVVHAVEAGQIALVEVPDRLGVDRADAVDATATVAVGPGVGVRLTRLTLEVVDVANTGAVETRIAVAGAIGRQEVTTDAGGVQAKRGVDVGDTLTGRAGDGAFDVEVVHAVAPLVIEHGGDFTGVGTTPAGTVEVDGGTVPERVTRIVDVHVGG